ncbi:uncharacterized protein [Henckelia pumila]|uniref:uncharacterized protein n=1 Tax=Henckelia pumila TaxID=405737 RepID=UPI003C6E5557
MCFLSTLNKCRGSTYGKSSTIHRYETFGIANVETSTAAHCMSGELMGMCRILSIRPFGRHCSHIGRLLSGRILQRVTNRNSESAGPETGTTKHVGGSKSYAVHTANLRQSLNREPSSWKIFLKTHKRQDETFAYDKSKMINEEVEHRIVEQYTIRQSGDLQSGDVHDYLSADEVNAIFMDAVGGVNHQRVYDIGAVAKTIYPNEMMSRPRFRTQLKSSLVAHDEAIRVARDEAQAARAEADVAKMQSQQNALALQASNDTQARMLGRIS